MDHFYYSTYSVQMFFFSDNEMIHEIFTTKIHILFQNLLQFFSEIDLPLSFWNNTHLTVWDERTRD